MTYRSCWKRSTNAPAVLQVLTSHQPEYPDLQSEHDSVPITVLLAAMPPSWANAAPLRPPCPRHVITSRHVASTINPARYGPGIDFSLRVIPADSGKHASSRMCWSAQALWRCPRRRQQTMQPCRWARRGPLQRAWLLPLHRQICRSRPGCTAFSRRGAGLSSRDQSKQRAAAALAGTS